MNALKKKRIGTVMKYTWPLYLFSAAILVFLMNFIFGVVHRTPGYQTLTLFVSGQLVDDKKLTNDMLEKFKDKELKSFSCISSDPSDGTYHKRLTVAGYNSADVFIIHESKLENLSLKQFALGLDEELINNMYSSFSLYTQDDVNYGVKLNKEKVKEYMALPDEDCYLVMNANSKNLGKYSKDQIAENDMALSLLKEWGM